MSIWHFGETLDAIRGGFKECPTFRPEVDFKKLRAAWNSYRANFPFADQLRHSIAHAANLDETAEHTKENAPKDLYVHEEMRVAIGGRAVENLINDRFINTINGQFVEYDINTDTAAALKAIAEEAYSAFTVSGASAD